MTPTRDAPFLVFALPRSRTAWLARFLSYGDWTCHHEQVRHLRSAEDARVWLSQDCTGTVETGIARWWRLALHWRPDLRVLVVRRPVEEVIESTLRLDMSGICTFDRAMLDSQLRKADRCLDRIEQEWPGVMSVRFADLASEQVCANVFEHCLPYDHDSAHWASLAPVNVQINMRGIMRHYFAHERLLGNLAQECRRHLRALDRVSGNHAPVDLSGVTFQAETFDDFWRDGQGVFAEHAAEVGEVEEIGQIDVPLCQRLDRLGVGQIVTARDEGRIVGYVASIISPSIAKAGQTSAMQNTFFVSKAYRGIGPRLELAAIALLRARGVDELLFRAGVRGSGPKMGYLARRLGAEEFGNLYRLDLKAA